MEPIEEYIAARDKQVRENLINRDLHIDTYRFTESLVKTNYVKNFTWRGVPILQYPTDLMVMQELIWQIKPNNIIEVGVAFGGMALFYAEILEEVSACPPRVIGVDVEFRPHTRTAISNFSLSKEKEDIEIILIEGSSTDPAIVKKVSERIAPDGADVLVSLDSNHTHGHVLAELRLYSPLVSVGSYIVVFDTAIEFFGHLDKNQERPWGVGNNPYTAVQEFLKENDSFVVDKEIEQRAVVTSAPGGWLKRVK